LVSEHRNERIIHIQRTMRSILRQQEQVCLTVWGFRGLCSRKSPRGAGRDIASHKRQTIPGAAITLGLTTAICVRKSGSFKTLEVARQQSGTTERGVENIVDRVQGWGNLGGGYVVTLRACGLDTAIEDHKETVPLSKSIFNG
jgi:hypothetical protein